ncbi:uncharacterized protein LOC141908439 [Tubulanus polymorphus]|uniref:uncharacterized protein LOC141908439 n=1 Tax=Tubulanus polymorphus TaxID=672921 RepID=UPI003DA680C5
MYGLRKGLRGGRRAGAGRKRLPEELKKQRRAMRKQVCISWQLYDEWEKKKEIIGINKDKEFLHYILRQARPPDEDHKESPFANSKSLSEFFNGLRHDNMLCDVILRVQNREGRLMFFHAHKLVLLNSSKYFKSLTKDELQKKCEFFLEDVSPDGIRLLLDYMYGLRLDHNEHLAHVEDVINAAEVLQVEQYLKHYKALKKLWKVSNVDRAILPRVGSNDFNFRALDNGHHHVIGAATAGLPQVKVEPITKDDDVICIDELTRQSKLESSQPNTPINAIHSNHPPRLSLNTNMAVFPSPQPVMAGELPAGTLGMPLTPITPSVDGIPQQVRPVNMQQVIFMVNGQPVPAMMLPTSPNITPTTPQSAPAIMGLTPPLFPIQDINRQSTSPRMEPNLRPKLQPSPLSKTEPNSTGLLDLSKSPEDFNSQTRPKPDHRCVRCNQSFAFMTQLRKHMIDVHKIDCFKMRKRKKMHYYYRYGKATVRQYACALCDMKMFSEMDLQLHIERIHLYCPLGQSNTELPYYSQQLLSCSYCHKDIASKKRLIKHIKKAHLSRKKRFKCGKCSRTFALAKSLRLHQSYKHRTVATAVRTAVKQDVHGSAILSGPRSEMQTKCGLQSRGNSPLSGRTGSVRISSSEKSKWICHLCSFVYNQRSLLIKHLQIIHSISNPNISTTASPVAETSELLKISESSTPAVNAKNNNDNLFKPVEMNESPAPNQTVITTSLQFSPPSLTPSFSMAPSMPVFPTNPMSVPISPEPPHIDVNSPAINPPPPLFPPFSLLRPQSHSAPSTPQAGAFYNQRLQAAPPVNSRGSSQTRSARSGGRFHKNEEIQGNRPLNYSLPKVNRDGGREAAGSMIDISKFKRGDIQTPQFSQMTFKLVKQKNKSNEVKADDLSSPAAGTAATDGEYELKLWPRKESAPNVGSACMYRCTQCHMPFSRIQCFTKHMNKEHGLSFAMAQVNVDQIMAKSAEKSARARFRAAQKKQQFTTNQQINQQAGQKLQQQQQQHREHPFKQQAYSFKQYIPPS